MVNVKIGPTALLIDGQHDRSTCEPTWIGVDHKINHSTISNAKKELKCPARDGMAATD